MRAANPERVERIIEIAARLFAEQPYHQVRVEDIAAKAGISKGTVYLHFKDKDDLYLALILHACQCLFERVQKTVRSLRLPEEKLLGVVQEVVGFLQKAPYFLELMQRADVAQSVVQCTALEQSRAQFRNLLIDIIADFNASQEERACDPELAAHALLGMMKETLRWRPATPDLPEQIVRLFLHGIEGQRSCGSILREERSGAR